LPCSPRTHLLVSLLCWNRCMGPPWLLGNLHGPLASWAGGGRLMSVTRRVMPTSIALTPIGWNSVITSSLQQSQYESCMYKNKNVKMTKVHDETRNVAVLAHCTANAKSE
jgi:hypothetical protein